MWNKFIKNGANPNVRDYKGMFPYELASDESIKKYLESITNKETDLKDSESTNSHKIFEKYLKHETEVDRIWKEKNELEESKRLQESK